MALTEPVGIQPPRPIAGEIGETRRAGIVMDRDDVRRVRMYGRLAAALRGVTLVLLALVATWLAVDYVEGQWRSMWALIPLSAAVLAAWYFGMEELRLRSYGLDLAPDAVIFEYGRRRAYVPRQHIQLVDMESSILLRAFDLRRCSLHTAGGSVVVSPIPAHAASAIERLINEQRTVTHAGPTNAGS